MQGTRGRIVDLLRDRGKATVDDLTQLLDLAPATVRRHLDVLQRDGHVALQAVRRATGRPHYVFSLTQAGKELLPGHYIGLTGRFISELLALGASDTKGKDGRSVALLAFERMSTSLLHACERSVTASRLPERLLQAVDALAEGGLVLESVARRGGYLLKVRECPCRWAGSAQESACRQAESVLERLLQARVQREAGDEPDECAYFVAEAADSGS